MFDLRVAVVMPDHVHMILMPLVDYEAMEVCSLARIMDAIKSASAHRINKTLGRKGRVWQAEFFAHGVRSSEGLGAEILFLLGDTARQGAGKHARPKPWGWAETAP